MALLEFTLSAALAWITAPGFGKGLLQLNAGLSPLVDALYNGEGLHEPGTRFIDKNQV